jgi:O-antigen ligase
MLSRSRTGIVAMIVVLLFFALVVIKQKLQVAIVGGFLIVATFMLVPAKAAKPTVSRYVYKGVQGDILSSRRESLLTTWQMAKERPIVGHGFGVSADTMAGQSWTGGFSTPIGFSREKSNSYLGVIEEVGLLGLLPLLAWLGYGVYRAARKLASIGWSDPIGMALLASVLSGLVHVNGEAWLTSAGSLEAFWFWWTAGVLFSPSFWRHARPHLLQVRR